MSSLPQNRWLVLTAVMLAFLPIVLDLTILHIAVPSLTLALSASGTDVLWIIDIYPLVMASLLIPMGTLADRVGHRVLLGAGLTIFLLASIGAAFAPTAEALIAARAVMAVGSAMVMPCILAIIRKTFDDDKERAIALGLWGAVGSAGAAVGPLIGGFLLEHFWWGSVFLVNVPILLLVGPLAVLGAPRHHTQPMGGWTIGQALALMTGLLASVYALKSFGKAGIAPVVSVAILAVGLALLTGFVRKQLGSPQPMLEMSLFSSPAIRVGVIMGLVVMGSLAGVELTLAQELQFAIGKSPLEAGIFMLPLMIASAVGGPIGGWLMGVAGLRWVASVSLFAAAAAMFGLSAGNLAAGGIWLVLLLALLGLSLSIGLTASSVAIMSSAPAEKAGSAGALEATSYDLGTGLGITAFGLLLAKIYTRLIDLPAGIPEEKLAAASASIGETMTVSAGLTPPIGTALAKAGKMAFSYSHGIVLLVAAVCVALLALLVVEMLRPMPEKSG